MNYVKSAFLVVALLAAGLGSWAGLEAVTNHRTTKVCVGEACPHCAPGTCCKMVLDKPRCQKCPPSN